jgi:hypothetical protein
MLHTPKRLKLLWLVVTIVLIMTAAAASSLAAQAGSADLIQTPMPSRPATATPRPRPTTAPEGAAIILQVQPTEAAPQLWTVVQWQGGDGAWHDVEGWRGAPDSAGQVRWWVAPYNSSRAEFRWVIYAGAQLETVLAVSETFALPKEPAETIVRRIVLDAMLPNDSL